jgi:hypothetical protein
MVRFCFGTKAECPRTAPKTIAAAEEFTQTSLAGKCKRQTKGQPSRAAALRAQP